MFVEEKSLKITKKMKFISYIFATFVILQMYSVSANKKQKCRALLRSADKATSKILMIRDEDVQSFPTMQEFQSNYCELVYKLEFLLNP